MAFKLKEHVSANIKEKLLLHFENAFQLHMEHVLLASCKSMKQRRMTLKLSTCEVNKLLTKVVPEICFSFRIVKRSLRAFQEKK